MFPTSLTQLGTRAFFPGPLVITKELVGPQNVPDVEPRGKQMAGLRETNIKLHGDGQIL